MFNLFKAIYYYLRYLVSFIVGINFFVKSDAKNSDDDNYMMHSANCGKTGSNDMKLKKKSDDMEKDIMMRCASCGIKEDDYIKLKKCGACNSVRYCGVKCQKKHRPKHKKSCKQRAAELREELLFKQPESTHLGDCPICFLPLPIHSDKFILATCCSKFICVSCNYANEKSEAEGDNLPDAHFAERLLPSRMRMSTDIMLRESRQMIPSPCDKEGQSIGSLGTRNELLNIFPKQLNLVVFKLISIWHSIITHLAKAIKCKKISISKRRQLRDNLKRGLLLACWSVRLELMRKA